MKVVEELCIWWRLLDFLLFIFFFFKQKTAYEILAWLGSDVCSSDLTNNSTANKKLGSNAKYFQSPYNIKQRSWLKYKKTRNLYILTFYLILFSYNLKNILCFLNDDSTCSNIRRAFRATHWDRKSTRLNSSHANISYAVFCLKKKKKKNHSTNSCIHH